MLRQKRVIPVPEDTDKPKVLLLIDWENLSFSLFNTSKPEQLDIDLIIKKLKEWLKKEIGELELLGGHGFVFAPTHISQYHRKICTDNQLIIVTCSKKKYEEKKKEEDSVDEMVVWFGMILTKIPNIEYVCLVSGDGDYIPMLEELKKNGVKIILAPPTLNCLNRGLLQLIDRNPSNKKRMMLILESVVV